jgi:hypothetical protein
MTLELLIGVISLTVGIVGAVVAVHRLTRSDLAQTVEVQHAVWEELRAALDDCHAELARLRRA